MINFINWWFEKGSVGDTVYMCSWYQQQQKTKPKEYHLGLAKKSWQIIFRFRYILANLITAQTNVYSLGDESVGTL